TWPGRAFIRLSKSRLATFKSRASCIGSRSHWSRLRSSMVLAAALGSALGAILVMFLALVLFAAFNRLSNFAFPCEEQEDSSRSTGKANRILFMAYPSPYPSPTRGRGDEISRVGRLF